MVWIRLYIPDVFASSISFCGQTNKLCKAGKKKTEKKKKKKQGGGGGGEKNGVKAGPLRKNNFFWSSKN